jgi:hypothetical protein
MTGKPHLTRRWPFGRVTEGLPTILSKPCWRVGNSLCRMAIQLYRRCTVCDVGWCRAHQSILHLVAQALLPVILSLGRSTGRRCDLTNSAEQELVGEPRRKRKPEICGVVVIGEVQEAHIEHVNRDGRRCAEHGSCEQEDYSPCLGQRYAISSYRLVHDRYPGSALRLRVLFSELSGVVFQNYLA